MISIIHDIKILIFLFTKLFNISKKYRFISKVNNFYTIISKNIRQKRLICILRRLKYIQNSTNYIVCFRIVESNCLRLQRSRVIC